MSKKSVRAAALGGGSALVALAAYELWARPWAARWGTTNEELRRHWPGDEFVSSAVQTVTHSITINAPGSSIWPWILQVGQDRAGFYSYSWLENLFGAEITNILRVVPEFQTRCVGDHVWMAPKHKYGGQARMVVARLDSGRAMVLVPPGSSGNIADDPPVDGTWAFIVEPVNATTTRLILRGRSGPKRTLRARFWEHVFWEPAHFIMERKMMRTIKLLAEEPILVEAAAPLSR
jgi:hypothetical protein